jgi:hypothetical protein
MEKNNQRKSEAALFQNILNTKQDLVKHFDWNAIKPA